jgi:hypothetical protein
VANCRNFSLSSTLWRRVGERRFLLCGEKSSDVKSRPRKENASCLPKKFAK